MPIHESQAEASIRSLLLSFGLNPEALELAATSSPRSAWR